MIPWFETPITYDVRAKPRNVASLTGTKGNYISIAQSLGIRSLNSGSHPQIFRWSTSPAVSSPVPVSTLSRLSTVPSEPTTTSVCFLQS